MTPAKWFKKAKVSKTLLKMAFEYDKKNGSHKWEKCALELEWRRGEIVGSRWSGLKAATGRTLSETLNS